MTNFIPTPGRTTNPGWTGRNEAIAAYIEPSTSILDLGCGSKDLLKYTSPSTYCGVDHFSNTVADVQIDLNSDFHLPEGTWDTIVCSGLLEYLEDLDHFFFRIKPKVNKLIITFWRSAATGINNPNVPQSTAVFEDILKSHFTVTHQSLWKGHDIYVCEKRNKGVTLNTYWFGDGSSSGNCGDILTPYILEKYGYDVVWTPASEADTICVGSIAGTAKAGMRVLGSGCPWASRKVNPVAQWVWVRGPLTRDRVVESGGTCPEIYGDAALLLPRFFKGSDKKIHDLGIVSHYVDYNTIKEKYPNHRIINMRTNNLEQTIREITECRKIVSSSLHGIIVANAYGIPAAWARFNPLSGDDSKFHDYAASVNETIAMSTIESPMFINPMVDTNAINNILLNKRFD